MCSSDLAVIARLRAGHDLASPLAQAIGQKGYHAGAVDGPPIG